MNTKLMAIPLFVLALSVSAFAVSLDEQYQQCADMLQPLIQDPANADYNSIISDYLVCRDSIVVVEGCTDGQASNYDPDANSDDGSCEYDFQTFGNVGEFYAYLQTLGDDTTQEAIDKLKYSCKGGTNMPDNTWSVYYPAAYLYKSYSSYFGPYYLDCKIVTVDTTSTGGTRYTSRTLWRVYNIDPDIELFKDSVPFGQAPGFWSYYNWYYLNPLGSEFPILE